MKRRISEAAAGLRQSVFARLADRMKRLPPDHYPLHIGDTWRLPVPPARLEAVDWLAAPDPYDYSHPFGLGEMLEDLAAKLRDRNGLPDADPGWLQVTCGATHALSCTALTLLDPGDEVLVLSPYWPLITGVLAAARARSIQVPFTDVLYEDPDADVHATLERHLTPGTRALYFANPNNPDGKVYEDRHLEAVAAFCREHDLWVLSDEVYEDYLYDGRRHRSIASLPGMAERTVTVFSFSKSHALAGYRLGYAVGPPEVIGTLRRVANHSVYNVSAAMQHAAHRALLHGGEFLQESRALYQQARDAMVAGLPGRVRSPDGGAYVFLSLGSEERTWELIHRCLDRAVTLAPGEAFGQAYRHYVRICFTAVPADRVERATAILREVLDDIVPDNCPVQYS